MGALLHFNLHLSTLTASSLVDLPLKLKNTNYLYLSMNTDTEVNTEEIT